VTCLYASDYGPVDPAFDPMVGGGQLLRGFESHASELARARNLGQLHAMERQLQRGQSITWCDPGYGWVESPAIEGFLAGFMLLVVLPHALKRLAPRLYSGMVERSRRWAATAAKLANKSA